MYSIYLITNIVNKKLYVGYTSKTIEKRWAEHISQSKSSKFKFYKAIRKYGIESFIITLILECQDKNEATLKEKYYIEKYNSIKNGYNTHSGGHGGNTGAYDKVSKKVSGEKNGMFGKTHSPETIEEIKKKSALWRESADGIKFREESRDRWIKNNPGKNKSEETKRKISIAKKGKIRPNSRKKYIITYPNGETIEVVGLDEFCKNNNLSQGNMASVASGKAKSYKKFKVQKSPCP